MYLTEIERIVKKFNYKNDFDLIFLNNIAKAKNDLNKSINLLTKGSYSELFSSEGNNVLCIQIQHIIIL